MNTVLLYLGVVIITLWGIGHLAPTRNIIAGFGDLSADNRRIITMEWIAEGLTLVFLGILVLLVNWLAPDSVGALIATRAAAAMLLALAALSLFTGARTAVLPMKLCPAVKTLTALLFLIGG
ncbi:MAG: hypothetical protein ABIA75_11710 [Candidatus Neomarinimicrobiota bacterium]